MSTTTNLIRKGSYKFKKLTDQELEDYDVWFHDYQNIIEMEEGRKLTKKEQDRLYKLILGIQAEYGEYDERYHMYLLGNVIGDKKRKLKQVV